MCKDGWTLPLSGCMWNGQFLAPCFGNEIEHEVFLENSHQDGSYFGSCVLPWMAEGPGDISGREENSVRERCGLLSHTRGAFLRKGARFVLWRLHVKSWLNFWRIAVSKKKKNLRFVAQWSGLGLLIILWGLSFLLISGDKISSCLLGLGWGLDEIFYVKYFVQRLRHGKTSVNGLHGCY